MDDVPSMLANRLRKNARHRSRKARREGRDCYRVYDRDIPQAQLTVDRYGEHLCISVWADDAEPLVAAVGPALEIPAERVHVKRRERQRGTQQYERLALERETAVVHEGGLRFEVNLSDHLDTGLFLDHRQTRALVREDAAGARVLNLFAYTGSFTVYAAAGGALTTHTVDLSAKYLDRARRNLELNDLWSARHRMERADTLALLPTLPAASYDLVVVDPPTFSNSKRMEATWDVQRDHAGLLAAVLRITAPGGVVWFSSNARRFKLDPIPGADVEDVTERTVPEDFRQRRPHRCWRLVKPR